MTLLGFTGLLNFASSSILAVIVFRKCPRRDVGFAYGLLNSVIAFWSFFYFLWQGAHDLETASFYFKLLLYGGIWINQALLYFCYVFTGRRGRARFWTLSGAALGNVLISVGIWKQIFYGTMELWPSQGYWPAKIHSMLLFYIVFWHIELIYSLWILYSRFQVAEGREKDQLKYMISAFSVGYAGGIVNWLPWFGLKIPPYPNALVTGYCLIVAYALFTQQLMDIKIAIKKTLLYSVVSAGLASLYAGMVTLLAQTFETGRHSPFVFSLGIFRWFGENPRVSFAYSCIATALFSACFGFFVWLKGRRKPIHILWLGMCLSVGVWGFGLGMLVRAQTWDSAYFWQCAVQYPGAIMIPIVFFHFVCRVLDLKPRWILWSAYALAIFLQILNASGHLVSIHLQDPFRYYTKPLGPYPLFIVYFFGLVLYAHYLLLKTMVHANERLKNQIKYLLIGTSVGFTGGSTSFFPVYGISIFPYGVYAVPFYIVLVGYAIFKHQLMDISVVIRKTLLYSLVSAALAAVYVGTITLLAHVLENQQGAISAYNSALAAVFITLLFNPFRKRIQVYVDKLFARERIGIEEKMAEFSTAVVNEHDPQKLTNRFFQALAEGFRPREVALCERSGVGLPLSVIASEPPGWPEIDAESIAQLLEELPTSQPVRLATSNEKGGNIVQAGIQVLAPLVSRGERMGCVLLGAKKSEEPYSEEDLTLLGILANQAAAVYERPRLLREVSGGFVHEVKMPLSKISLPAELTFMEIEKARRDGGLAEEALAKIQHRMQYIMDQVKAASQRVDALRDLTQVEENRRTEIHLPDLIRRSFETVADLTERSRVRTRLSAPETCPPVLGDPRQLEIVFTNLFKNAVEAMDALPAEHTREIQVELRVLEGRVEIAVQDTGPGIPPEDWDRVFHSHYTTKGFGGSGMGLFLCRQILQAHGGSISIVPGESGGTAFALSLPIRL